MYLTRTQGGRENDSRPGAGTPDLWPGTQTMTTYESIADESIDLDERDIRALTQYLTVLEDQGRVCGADDLYLVVSQSGSEYLVDARERTCECPDHEYRGVHCKHQRRVEFATGERPIPDGINDVDPSLGEHVSASPQAVATDGGVALGEMDGRDEILGYTRHIEPEEQGGKEYVRCEGCSRELLIELGGDEQLSHAPDCSNVDRDGPTEM